MTSLAPALSQTSQAPSPKLWPLGVRFVREFADYAGTRGALALVFVGLGAVLEGTGLILLIPILTVAIHMGGTPHGPLKVVNHIFDLLGLHSRFQRLALLLSGFALLMVVRALVISARDSLLNRLQIGFVESRRAMITRRLAAARWEVISRLRHSRISHLMGGEIQQLGAATNVMMQSGVSVVMFIALCGLALSLSPILTVLTLGMTAIGALTLGPVLQRGFALGSFVSNANLSLMNSTGQFLSGLKLAVSQDLQADFVAEFEETLAEVSAKRIEINRRQTNRRLVLSTVSALAGALVLLVGFGALNLEPAVLATVLLVLSRVSGPATQLQQGAQQFVQTLPAYEKIKDLEAELAAAETEVVASDPDGGALDGPIAFRGVGFRHADAEDRNPDAQTINNLDLVIEPGAFVGIAGASGAGKTTFADLLAGLFAPRAGEITVGGVPLTPARLGAWRRRMSYVSQDPFLFHDTIRRNLLWGAPQSSEADMWAALRLAGAENLVRGMEQGLETVVGERGTLVSGGERQRIALARAVLRRPRLLILDEATNAIDIAGERELFKHLSGLAPRPTIVVIAHRTESLSACDRVYAFAQGRMQLCEDRAASVS